MLSSDVRYDTNTEKEMIKSGYKIKLDGKSVK
jgi:chaperone required for assembly of F1-ATPase